MSKPLRVLALLSQRLLPSSRLRLKACFDDFLGKGIEASAMPIPSGPLGRIRMIIEAGKHDVIIIQKKTSLKSFELALLRWRNPRIVFDMDDAVMFHELEHSKRLSGKDLPKFLRTINHCAGVVAGNAFLARFAEPNCPRVKILPTPIDIRTYAVKDYDAEVPEAVTVGWLGVAGNLRYLRRLAPVFQRLALRHPKFRLKIVSNGFIDIPGVTIIKEQWSLETENQALCSFDIGIMPLDDSLWSRGKCGYKILQYMGVGAPAVASPVGINTEFIRPGKNGLLATTEEDWEAALEQLISDPSYRRQLGLQGRADVESRYSLERYVEQYASFLREVAAAHPR